VNSVSSVASNKCKRGYGTRSASWVWVARAFELWRVRVSWGDGQLFCYAIAFARVSAVDGVWASRRVCAVGDIDLVSAGGDVRPVRHADVLLSHLAADDRDVVRYRGVG